MRERNELILADRIAGRAEYTSGTPGDPKGVVCSNGRYVGASMLGYLSGLQPEDRPYNGLSLTHGNECPPGGIGELISRPSTGEHVEVEYFKNEDASKRKTEGGWLRSGDMCHRDEDGWFYFDFRKGGGIRHNGDFVNPGFVERVIAEHPQVDDVFVYGVPAASGAPGESDVVAAIVPVDASGFDPASVFRMCEKGLESNFVPSYLQVVDEIPETASEKPQERFLLERLTPDAVGVYARRH